MRRFNSISIVPRASGAAGPRRGLSLLALAAVLFGAGPAGATVIFDNFDPNGGFHPQFNSTGAASNYSFSLSGIRAAARFTVSGGSSQLTSITLPVSVQRNVSSDILRVRLTADDGGVPGTTLEVLSENQNIWPTLTNPFTTTTTLYSVTHPVLVGGASYWIVLEPTSMVATNFTFVDYRWFHNTTGTTVPFLQETEAGLPTDPWHNPSVSNRVAFRVEGPACFTDVAAGLPGVYGPFTGNGSAAWGDYDNDGDLDVLLSGSMGGPVITRIYRSSGGVNPTFSDAGAGLAGIFDGGVAWGDYDNDGDLDLLLTGFDGATEISRVYRNNGGANPTFSNASGSALTGVILGATAWGDYDNDGDLDFLLTGLSGATSISKLYRNSGGSGPTWSDAGVALTGVHYSSVAWGDYDSDGDLDILLAGSTGTTAISRIYRNNGGANPTFSDIGAGIPQLGFGSAAWGDYDNDGDLDILLAGSGSSDSFTKVLRSSGGANPTFSDTGAGLPVGQTVAWGDYDNDGDLEVLLTGHDSVSPFAKVFRNDCPPPANSPPAPPANLAAAAGEVVTFTWSAATDAQTPAPGLSYNLRVGTSPGASNIVASTAAATGWRRLPAAGNANANTAWPVKLPAPGTYYWSVQAIDGAFAGSPFATEQVLNVPTCFTDLGAGLAGAYFGDLALGDYDNDGDLDLLITGATLSETVLYRSSGGSNPTFTNAGAGLPGTTSGVVAWGDYDNDGDLDIFIGGSTATVYRNSGGPNPTFGDIGFGLTDVEVSSAAWGDYDNDDDLDILLTGVEGPAFASMTRLYRNSGGPNPTFSDVAAGMTAVEGVAAWGDVDNDGDLDIAVSGLDDTTARLARIYRNSGGPNPTFSDLGAGLTGVTHGSVAWGDYDNDGDQDLLLAGRADTGSITRLYRNSGGPNPTFADAGAGLPGVGYSASGAVAWGDYDKDGHLDIALAGGDGTSSLARVYRNSGGPNPTFARIPAFLPGLQGCALAWGDCDNDADLDLVLTGFVGGSPAGISRIYTNACALPKPRLRAAPAANLAGPNTPPTAPTDLYGRVDGTLARFSWTAATDAQTPSDGLSYNLRIGTSPGAGDILSPMANVATGFRRVPSVLGNVNQNTTWEVNLPAPGTYYWSVQAVDGGSSGSSFAVEEIPVGVEESAAPQGYALSSEGPNPFAGAMTIHFSQPATGRVSLAIYDSAGRRVRTLVDEVLRAGAHARPWDGKDDSGRVVQSGIYFTRMKTAAFEESHKIVVVR